ncbi:MAG: LuxR C-terminal-related transcriptional regulator, partial [Burkholderiaceae bacterium]
AAVWRRVAELSLAANDVDDIVIGMARWEIAFGDPRAALAQLEPALAAAVAASRHGRALKLRLLMALASQRAGDDAAALALAAPALQQAGGEGFVRIVLDEGPAFRGVLELCLPLARGTAGRRSDPILGEYLERLLQSLGPAPSTEHELPVKPADADTAEALTRKEIRVLQLLAEGYSNGAMAEKLFVSDSTVRTHLRNINSKLNAQSRMQAVAIGRKLGVLP